MIINKNVRLLCQSSRTTSPNSYSSLKTLLLALSFAAVALFAASALSACSKEAFGAPIEDMESFYNESRGLTKVSPDSIQRFATKVENYVTYYPETKSDPYYPEIVDNINDAAKLCGLTIHITLNPEWEGEIEYNY